MNQQTCNRAWLDAFLKNDLNEREEQMLTSHLDECSDCREELESRAAEQSVWREASNLLGGSILLSTAAIGDHRSGTVQSPQIALVLQQLAPTDDPESLGRIGGYEVTGVVGAGGMGVVLKVHDRSLDRIVAIKVMSPHLASNGSARKRFAREAKAAAAVLHPNVIAIHSVASEDANPYLVMPFVRGASLQKRIDSQGPLPLKDTLRIGAQIAAGLAAAHEQGLVHRDIKPANILLEEGVERVTITDFGLARAVDDASMTCSGVIAGTPQYMSPEQARGEPIDARSDLFSLGGVLYAMCTGRSPFRAETTYGVLHRIANDNPTPVCEVNTDVPVWLGHVIQRLMAKRPEDRFESAAQVAEMLEGCLAHVQQPTAIPLPNAVAALAPKMIRRPPMGKFIAAVALAFAFVFGGVTVLLELNKGTLTIQSDVDDIRVRITRSDEVVNELKVTKVGQSIRVAAGQYKVEVIGETDDLTIENGLVTLHRADTEVVRIVHNANNQEASHADLNKSANAGVRQVFANIDGEVNEILVGHNSVVSKGQVLLRLRNDELQIALTKTSGQLKETSAGLDRITKKAQNNKDLPQEEVEEMQRDRSVLQKRVVTLTEQMTQLNQRCESLVVKSTVAGTILTKDVEQLLKNRLVVAGQVLLEIAIGPNRTTIESAENNEKTITHADEDGEVVTVSLKAEWVSEEWLKRNIGRRYLTIVADGIIKDEAKPNVVNRVQFIMIQHADADDLAQQVFLSVAKAIEQWQPDSKGPPFRAWLARITRNAIINALTQRRDAAGGSASVQEMQFPTEKVAQLMSQVKQDYDVSTAITQLSRITGLHFGSGVEPQSRNDWLGWWQCERDCIDRAVGEKRQFIIVGIVKDEEGKAVSGASVQVNVPYKESAADQYKLGHTIADHNGQYVLGFGLPKFAKEEVGSIPATISVMQSALYKTVSPITIQLPFSVSLPSGVPVANSI